MLPKTKLDTAIRRRKIEAVSMIWQKNQVLSFHLFLLSELLRDATKHTKNLKIKTYMKTPGMSEQQKCIYFLKRI